MAHSIFRDTAKFQTIRMVETLFEPGQYGYLMADMILSVVQPQFEKNCLEGWYQNLKKQYQNHDYYFAIDLVVATLRKVE